MIKVAIYARVSTQQQKDERTIESQIDELEEVVKRHDLKIVKQYIDDGCSGAILDRPGLNELREDAKKGIFERVYFHSDDRLARKQLHQAMVVHELQKYNIEIYFKDRSIEDTPEGKFLFMILGAASELEREKIIERTMRGRMFKAKQGKLLRCRPPFGYIFAKDEKGEWQLEINPKEAEIVHLIFDLYLQYQSASRLAKELFERNILTRNGKMWRSPRITEILRRETYIGNWHFNRTERIMAKDSKKKFRKRFKSGRRIKAKKDWIVLKIPAIIDKDQFELAQDLLKRNYKVYGKTKHPYLLSGILECGHCSSRMVGFGRVFPNRRHFYYRCYQRVKMHPRPYTCKSSPVKIEDIESFVWDRVVQAIQSPKELLEYASYLKEGDKDKEILTEMKSELLKKQEHMKQKKNILWGLWDENKIDKDELTEKIGDYSENEKQVKRSIKEIDKKLSQTGKKEVIIKQLNDFAELTKPQLEGLDFQGKKDFLKLILKKVIYYSKTKSVDIIGHIPLLDITKKEWQDLTQEPVLTLTGPSIRSLQGYDFLDFKIKDIINK